MELKLLTSLSVPVSTTYLFCSPPFTTSSHLDHTFLKVGEELPKTPSLGFESNLQESLESYHTRDSYI